MQYINSQQSLEKAIQWMRKFDLLAVDLECENNLHHYGTYISLIQISCPEQDFIIDVLDIEDVTPLLAVLEDKSIRKIFHDVSFDLRILHYELKCRPKNIFDTQLAALLTGEKDIGLGSLLQKHFGIQKERRYQMADWTKRPLTKDMLKYAAKDSRHLFPLYKLLVEKLQATDRYEWALQECAYIEKSGMTYKENVFTDFKGFKFLPKKKQAILRNLFDLREELAQKVDMPNYYVMSNQRIQEILEKPPQNVSTWRTIKGVHPVVKRNARRFYEATTQYSLEDLPAKKVHPRYTPEQKEKTFQLNTLVEKVAKKLGIRKHLIMNKDQIQQIVLFDNYDSLRDWQKELVVN